MPHDFRPVLVKGRGNYLSLRRLRVAQQKLSTLARRRPAAWTSSSQIGRWSRQTADGSRTDLPFQPYESVVGPGPERQRQLPGPQVPDYAECFYFKARKQVFGANLLVVNHALFFSDLALRRAGGGLLPDYQAVIFDEAHTLEDVAADHLGLQVSAGRRRVPAQQAARPRSATRAPRHAAATPETVAQLEVAAAGGRAVLHRRPRTGTRTQPQGHRPRPREPNIVPDHALRGAGQAGTALHTAARQAAGARRSRSS